MKKNQTITKAILPGVIAVAAILLFVYLPISVDNMAGIATVVGLYSLAALEYRF